MGPQAITCGWIVSATKRVAGASLLLVHPMCLTLIVCMTGLLVLSMGVINMGVINLHEHAISANISSG